MSFMQRFSTIRNPKMSFSANSGREIISARVDGFTPETTVADVEATLATLDDVKFTVKPADQKSASQKKVTQSASTVGLEFVVGVNEEIADAKAELVRKAAEAIGKALPKKDGEKKGGKKKDSSPPAAPPAPAPHANGDVPAEGTLTTVG